VLATTQLNIRGYAVTKLCRSPQLHYYVAGTKYLGENYYACGSPECTNNLAEEVPEPHESWQESYPTSPNDLLANSLILRVYEVLMNDSRRRQRQCQQKALVTKRAKPWPRRIVRGWRGSSLDESYRRTSQLPFSARMTTSRS